MRTFKRKPFALILAHAIGAGSLIAASPGVMAQPATPDLTTPQKLERMTVTGSSIRRTQTEGALPVLTLDRTYIEQSGATTATELIQSLPQIQNFVANSASVNGGGGGTATAALHALPSKYTLVLIDGQRTPPTALSNSFGGGFGVNINSIPLDAVDHVEILLDGATAIYGSDAIAGVVNFILKKNSTEGNVYAEAVWPQHRGAMGYQAGISKGWGDLEKDGFNIQGSFRYVQQDQLEATQRSFSARGAFFPFSHDGVNYFYNGRTSNTEPANVTFRAKPATGGPTQAYTLNPFYNLNGNCGSPFAGVITDTASLGAIGQSCRFNYAATVQDLPPYDQTSFLGKGYLKLGADATAWVMVGLSDFDTKPRYAPPAQPLGIGPARLPGLYNSYVVPFLTANGLVNASSSSTSAATIGYRAVSQGGRRDDYDTKWQQYAVGVDGKAWDWDYHARITSGVSTITDTLAGGYTDAIGFAGAVNAGLYDPVLSTGTASIKPFILSDRFSRAKSTLNSLHIGAQHDFFELPGGPTILAVGAEYVQNKYSVGYSDLAQSGSGFSTQPVSDDTVIGGGGGNVPVSATRNNWAAYGEWFVPVLKNLEATASVRYDYYDKTSSKFVFALSPDATGLIPQIANADLGNTFSKTTGKISVRWLPVESVLLRGSYGTGFRAPAASDIAGALAFAGSTQNSYACPFPGAAGCLPGSAQYDLLAGPNGLSGEAGLKPETSTQYTLGGRWEPFRGLSFGADYWSVKIKNQVLSQGIPEAVAFANPQQYLGLFTNPYTDPVGQFPTIALAQVPFNGGQANYSGIDWDFSWRTNTAWGVFNASWTGTQMLKAQYNFGAGEPFQTDLAKYGPDQQVVIRTTMQIIGALQTGAWLNSLTFHYKSGYQDSPNAGANIFLANPDGSLGKSVTFCCLHVKEYYTFDWQTQYNFTKDVKLTAGITNLFDKDPPLSLQAGGGGNQIGYDGRYTDPIGRAFYARAAYKF